jgi:FlaA1/EpsC-like NDP-sugar epimerase
MLVQQRAAQSQGRRFACVRFGNVVGSQGSIIPIFLRQIAEGNAITIGDKRTSRYFMTIKEAVSLVLQASSLASDDEIYVLDMGDPVKITDVAHSLVKMSGLIPEKDVPIKTIGIRPGEKLHEQLWYQDARVCPTEFPRVYSVAPEELPSDLDTSINDAGANCARTLQ